MASRPERPDSLLHVKNAAGARLSVRRRVNHSPAEGLNAVFSSALLNRFIAWERGAIRNRNRWLSSIHLFIQTVPGKPLRLLSEGRIHC